MACKTHSFTSCSFWHTVHFKHYTTWFNYCYPVFRRTFTGTHTSTSWFSCNWFVRENFNPYFTTTFDITSHSNTGSFDLTVSDPRWFACYQAELTMRHCITAHSTTFHTAAELLTMFYALWNKHYLPPSSFLAGCFASGKTSPL